MACLDHNVSYHNVDLKRQNRFTVGRDKRKLKAKMQSVSDDNVRKRLLDSAPPNPSHAGWYSIYLPQRDGRLS